MQVYDSMPKHLQLTLDACAAQTNVWQLSEFEANNGEYLEKILSTGKSQIFQFPNDVMDNMRKLAKETLEEEASKDPLSRKVHEAFKAFKKRVGGWGQFSEAAYHQLIAEKIEIS